MLGYHNNPKATADTVSPDGWLNSGDVGYYNDRKEFYIVDRIKELIKVQGYQVSVFLIDNFLFLELRYLVINSTPILPIFLENTFNNFGEIAW